MDTPNIFVHNDVDICVKDIDNDYIYYHNEPSNPHITITKSVYIYFPILSDLTLGVLLFVKNKNNQFKQYFFNKTILFKPQEDEIIYSHQIIVYKLNPKYGNTIIISAIDSNGFNYKCYMTNPNISLLINGATSVFIDEINDNKYCLEYELDINNNKNIRYHYIKTEIIQPKSENYIAKLKLVNKNEEYDYAPIPQEETNEHLVEDLNKYLSEQSDKKIFKGNRGLIMLCLFFLLFLPLLFLIK